jgi:hypothetical protein
VAFPEPVNGLVIRYSYLWQSEHQRGQEERRKDRACAVLLVTQDEGSDKVVTVLPVTHSPPAHKVLAVEIPAATKKRLGLDDERSWVVLTEANRFVWPGPDLRPVRPGDMSSVAFGLLPGSLMEEIRAKFVALVRAQQAKVVPRSD